MNLEQVADELYALAPAAFTAARDEQAGQARASGDADLAGEIKKLRRPTVSAWLVNLLAREDGGQMDELLEPASRCVRRSGPWMGTGCGICRRSAGGWSPR